MKKFLSALALALVAVVFVWLMNKGEYTRTEYMLNTIITISAKNEVAVDKCFEEISRIEKLLSVYLAESDISKINSAPCGQAVEVSSETASLIERANTYKEATEGDFDITIKPVADLWDIAGGGRVPDEGELARAVSLCGDVEVSTADSTVTLPAEGMKIDLGGIAKGYAADRVREILVSSGVDSAIADLGGNIVAIGKNGRKSWRIGLQHPERVRGNTFAYIEAEDKFIVTSGGYERYFEKDGQTYHHIIDPATGKNPENDILSVTVVSENGTLADALSTACFVAGKEKAVALAERMGAELVIYAEDGIYSTDGIKNSLFITGER